MAEVHAQYCDAPADMVAKVAAAIRSKNSDGIDILITAATKSKFVFPRSIPRLLRRQAKLEDALCHCSLYSSGPWEPQGTSKAVADTYVSHGDDSSVESRTSGTASEGDSKELSEEESEEVSEAEAKAEAEAEEPERQAPEVITIFH